MASTQKPPPIHLHIHQAGTWRAYALPFERIRRFTDFQQIADELLQDCVQSESTPAPGGWDVLDYGGSILTRRFWEDLAVPGGKYFLAPGATATPRPTPQPQQQQEPQVPQVNSTPNYYPEPPRNYSDPLNPRHTPPPRLPPQTPGHTPPPLLRPEHTPPRPQPPAPTKPSSTLPPPQNPGPKSPPPLPPPLPPPILHPHGPHPIYNLDPRSHR
ncbi:hypothetical protein BDD12DRAFT_805674 [Trichophaea hybrida]|nr:hypothetical protein BDD12DRAFT_805674 [Trichophaea hybrida]